MNDPHKHKLILLSKHGDEYRVDFFSKKEKWEFIQEYFPDMAEMIANFSQVFGGETGKIGFPFFLVKESFLKTIPVETFDRHGNPFSI